MRCQDGWKVPLELWIQYRSYLLNLEYLCMRCGALRFKKKKKKCFWVRVYENHIVRVPVFHSYFFWCLWFICHGQVDASLCCVCTFVYSFGLAKTACLIFHFSCLNGLKGPEWSHTHTHTDLWQPPVIESVRRPTAQTRRCILTSEF